MNRLVAAIAALSISVPSLAAELTVILGTPSESFAPIIEKRVNLSQSTGDDFSDRIYALLQRNDVISTVAVELVGQDGSASKDLFNSAISQSTSFGAPIVLSVIGPVEDTQCQLMVKQKDTVFVLASGNDGQALQAHLEPNCVADNILFVAAYDNEAKQLAVYTNTGDLVRVAASDTDGTSKGTSFSAAHVTAKLAEFKRAHKTLRGGSLVTAFLNADTTETLSLEGKIDGARLLN